ncbi:hypothetical protein QVD17_21067 [Tagetes erecta]|uniref:non-specific serine/threonine protein kinase n=1 Tax=Tagetes erecta TaxID=13708 RepID=A0AAD8KSU3_TARER|nr:hypothetical protein QVD17_21067 [Tagetes erecta]
MEENKFSGKLTVEFAKLKDIYYINLSNNLFGSEEADDMKFISSLGNCTNLLTLALDNCKFQGVLPGSIGNLSIHLREIYMGGNQLRGNIPSSIGNLVGLVLLPLESNQFTGSIPSTIGNLQNLQFLDLSRCQLSGTIPDAIGNLSSFINLHVFSNKLEGEIPSSLGNFRNLLDLYLGDNKLTGKIPRQIFQLLSLSIILDLSHNKLFGSLPTEVGDLKMLSLLNLAYNDLSGNIPSSLGGCGNLVGLSLEGNLFQGMIPSSFSSLKGLSELDISHNNLSGTIPRFLENMKLEYLNLSYNDFEGEVPMGGVFFNESAFSILGNSRLCGGFVKLGLPKCKKKKNYTKNECLPTIVHGDLKPSNILLDDDMVAHVGDFGLARVLGTSYLNNSTGIRGTVGYVAPEYGMGSEMTSSGDVYSFGILVLEVMTGKEPTSDIFNEHLSLHKYASMALQDHVTGLLDVNIIKDYEEDKIAMRDQGGNVMKIDECLASTIKIGVSCSMHSPTQRMDIKRVVHELQQVLSTLENI